MTKAIIGVDLSKDHFDAHRLPDGAAARFGNDKRGYRAFRTWLKGWTTERIVFEASGPYSQAFHVALADAGLPLAMVNPRQARHFAKASGQLAKTDAVDAAMLARMGRALEPKLTPAPGKALQNLKELETARRGLIKERTAALNRSHSAGLPLLQRQLAKRIKLIETQLADIEKAMMDIVRHDQELARRFEILTSITGIGQTSALAILVNLPELGNLKAKPLAALAGLAPFARQSGQWKGSSKIRDGRSALRQALYLPAIVACRFNPDLAAKYRKMRAAGKLPKVAIVAVMRKLLLLANALIRDDRDWTPLRP